VPVLVLDGEVICDSRRIIEHLEHRRAAAPVTPGAPGSPRR
jgi:glutathione S-transferase